MTIEEKKSDNQGIHQNIYQKNNMFGKNELHEKRPEQISNHFHLLNYRQ